MTVRHANRYTKQVVIIIIVIISIIIIIIIIIIIRLEMFVKRTVRFIQHLL